MIDVQMAFACENVESGQGKPFSFQNIMDGIAALEFPAMTGRWLAVFCFYSKVETAVANCRVIVVDENEEVLAQKALKDLTFTANGISRTIVAFQGVAWPHPGRYYVKFVGNRDDVLAYFPMVVQLGRPDEDAGASKES